MEVGGTRWCYRTPPAEDDGQSPVASLRELLVRVRDRDSGDLDSDGVAVPDDSDLGGYSGTGKLRELGESPAAPSCRSAASSVPLRHHRLLPGLRGEPALRKSGFRNS